MVIHQGPRSSLLPSPLSLSLSVFLLLGTSDPWEWIFLIVSIGIVDQDFNNENFYILSTQYIQVCSNVAEPLSCDLADIFFIKISLGTRWLNRMSWTSNISIDLVVLEAQTLLLMNLFLSVKNKHFYLLYKK